MNKSITTFILAALLFTQALAGAVTSNPTSNTSPDPGQGGAAVTSPANTGHASTTSSCGGESCTENKTCLWTAFQAVSGPVISITLKISHASSGALSGATAANTFTLEYSLNGGGAWNTAVSRTNFTSSEGPTMFSVALSAGQNISQVQVRDAIVATTNAAGHSASATATVSDIRLEVVTQDAGLIVMM